MDEKLTIEEVDLGEDYFCPKRVIFQKGSCVSKISICFDDIRPFAGRTAVDEYFDIITSELELDWAGGPSDESDAFSAYKKRMELTKEEKKQIYTYLTERRKKELRETAYTKIKQVEEAEINRKKHLSDLACFSDIHLRADSSYLNGHYTSVELKRIADTMDAMNKAEMLTKLDLKENNAL